MKELATNKNEQDKQKNRNDVGLETPCSSSLAKRKRRKARKKPCPPLKGGIKGGLIKSVFLTILSHCFQEESQIFFSFPKPSLGTQ